MLIISPRSKQHVDQLLRAYKQKVDETKLAARVKNQMFFKKPSQIRKKEKARAIYTQRYRTLHDLV